MECLWEDTSRPGTTANIYQVANSAVQNRTIEQAISGGPRKYFLRDDS
jgi:hypothetical protein